MSHPFCGTLRTISRHGILRRSLLVVVSRLILTSFRAVCSCDRLSQCMRCLGGLQICTMIDECGTIEMIDISEPTIEPADESYPPGPMSRREHPCEREISAARGFKAGNGAKRNDGGSNVPGPTTVILPFWGRAGDGSIGNFSKPDDSGPSGFLQSVHSSHCLRGFTDRGRQRGVINRRSTARWDRLWLRGNGRVSQWEQ